jgi:glutamyl-tRNA synthetase
MLEKQKEIRVRFAPSPTGHMHLGSARTALYDFLFARKHGGKFVLRIEDTDRKRYVEGAENELIQGMRWLGIDWDEGPDKGGEFGPYRQSERKEIYQDYGRKLIEKGMAYYCFCTQERLEKVKQQKIAKKELLHYDGTCRGILPAEAQKRVDNGEEHVLRFKSPKTGTTTINDFIRGQITIENSNLDDTILIKSDGWALYHLAATVDDHLMQISHVIRGSEWLSTFPLHSLIHRSFGWDEPVWVHLSVFLKPSGKGKMSKREASELIESGHSIFIKDLQGLGYLPEGVINWIALMGWSYDDRIEYFDMQDLVDKFTLENLNPAPAAINFSKLDYFNKEHIKNLTPNDLAERMKPFFIEMGLHPDEPSLIKIAPIINERITTLDDAVGFSKFFFTDQIEYEISRLIIPELSVNDTAQVAAEIRELLNEQKDIKAEKAESVIQEYLNKKNLTAKQVFTFMREAISGQQVTPPLFQSMEILGRDKVLLRLENVIQLLDKTK